MVNNNLEKRSWAFNTKSSRDYIEKNKIIKNLRQKLIEKKKREKEKL